MTTSKFIMVIRLTSYIVEGFS